jgi:hypothetical protein
MVMMGAWLTVPQQKSAAHFFSMKPSHRWYHAFMPYLWCGVQSAREKLRKCHNVCRTQYGCAIMGRCSMPLSAEGARQPSVVEVCRWRICWLRRVERSLDLVLPPLDCQDLLLQNLGLVSLIHLAGSSGRRGRCWRAGLPPGSPRRARVRRLATIAGSNMCPISPSVHITALHFSGRAAALAAACHSPLSLIDVNSQHSKRPVYAPRRYTTV